MNILIGMPTPEYVHADFALSNLQELIYYTKKHRPDVSISLLHEMGVRTDANRNKILKSALEAYEKPDYILWLDTDMIYPKDMIVKYLEAEKDVIGCIYFKRSEPYQPVVYLDESEPGRFRPLEPSSLGDEVIEVAALGFGGMMVRLSVYEAMGDDKWMNYGKYFHIPENIGTSEDHNTHDIVFCREAKKYGYKIHVHGGVRASHISTVLINEATYTNHNKKTIIATSEPVPDKKKHNICVVMPTINPEKAKRTLEQLKVSAGYDDGVVYYSVIDHNRVGFVKTFWDAVQNIDADYYVYTAEDAYGGKDWLWYAYNSFLLSSGTLDLFCFNDGKWFGELASFGMARKDFIKKYWHTGYKSHYVDVELTQIAKEKDSCRYDPEVLMLEVDYGTKSVNQDDRKLWNERKKSLGLSQELQEQFS